MSFNAFLPLEGLTRIASCGFIVKRETHDDPQSPRQAGRRPARHHPDPARLLASSPHPPSRSEEHTSELQSLRHLVCRLLLEKKTKHARLLANSECAILLFYSSSTPVPR